MQEKRSLKISLLMLIVAMLITYLTLVFFDLNGGFNGITRFSAFFVIALIFWVFLVHIYYINKNSIIDALNSLLLYLVSTRLVISYFHTLLGLTSFCGRVYRSLTSGLGRNLLLFPIIIVLVWIIVMIYAPLAVTPINEKSLSDTMNNVTKALDNKSKDIYKINKNASIAQNALINASPEIVRAKDHLINASWIIANSTKEVNNSYMRNKNEIKSYNVTNIKKFDYSMTEAYLHLSNASTRVIGANLSVHNASVALANLTGEGGIRHTKIFGNVTAVLLHALINETTSSLLLVFYYYWKSMLALWLLSLFLMSAMRSRRLMVIEEFVDNTDNESQGQAENDSTGKDGKSNQNKSICKGLNVLLASRLIYLNDVFRSVNEDRNITTASGVDVSMPATVQVDEISDLLQGAITPESKLELGPFQLPASVLLYPIQRLFKGPRIVGSLHKDGDKTILMAQIVGWNRPQTWRVCDPICIMDPEHPENRDRHEREDMVYELAYRIFTDLTYGDSFSWSQKWKATYKFSEGLSKYRDCLRTDKDKKLNLKKAEKLFIETLAEDLDFTSAYYNLGVVYTELKQQQAAKVAFLKAIDKDTTKKKWEAYYALGQNIFESAKEDLKAVETLRKKILFRAVPVSNHDEAVIHLYDHLTESKYIYNKQLANIQSAEADIETIKKLKNASKTIPLNQNDKIVRISKADLEKANKDVTELKDQYNKISDNFENIGKDIEEIEKLQKIILPRTMPISHDYIDGIINQYDEVIRLCSHITELREQDEIQLDYLDAAKVYDLKGLAEKGKYKCYSIRESESIGTDFIKESINDHQKSSIFALIGVLVAKFTGTNVDRFLHIASECLLDLSCAHGEMAKILRKFYLCDINLYEDLATCQERERFLRLATAIKPENANSHYELGNLYIDYPISENIIKRLDEYKIANNISPDKSKYLIALASARSRNWNQDDKTCILNSCKKALYSNLDTDCDSIIEIMNLYIDKLDEMNLSSLAFSEEYLYRSVILEDLKGYDKLGKLGKVYRKWILDVLNELIKNNFNDFNAYLSCPSFGVFKETSSPCKDFAWIYAQIIITLCKLIDFEDENIASDYRDGIKPHLRKAIDLIEEKIEKDDKNQEIRTWMKSDDLFTCGCLYNEIKRIENNDNLRSKRDEAFDKAEERLRRKIDDLKFWQGLNSNDKARDYALYLREYINIEIKIGQLYLKESSKKNNIASINKMDEARKAYDHLKKALNELEGDDEEIRCKRLRVHEACSLKNNGDYKNALREAQRARILNPLNDFDFTHLGEIYFELDEFKKAKEEWDNALFWRPDEPETYVNIGRSYLERAKLCRNEQNKEKIDKENDKNERISALNNAEENLHKALVLYERDQVRERGEARYLLGKTYMELGAYSKAIPHFKIVYKTTSKNPGGSEFVAGLKLGTSLLKMHDYNECEMIFTDMKDRIDKLDKNIRILKYDHDSIPISKVNAWIKLGLAYSYIYRSANFAEALKLITDSYPDLDELGKEEIKSEMEQSELNQILSKCFSARADCMGLLLYESCKIYGEDKATKLFEEYDKSNKIPTKEKDNCSKIESMIDKSIYFFERSLKFQADARTYIHLGMACEFKYNQIWDKDEKSCLRSRSESCCKLAEELDIKGEYPDEIKDLLKDKD